MYMQLAIAVQRILHCPTRLLQQANKPTHVKHAQNYNISKYITQSRQLSLDFLFGSESKHGSSLACRVTSPIQEHSAAAGKDSSQPLPEQRRLTSNRNQPRTHLFASKLASNKHNILQHTLRSKAAHAVPHAHPCNAALCCTLL
jgi:hypothetical protein